jgi:hypothetical protein
VGWGGSGGEAEGRVRQEIIVRSPLSRNLTLLVRLNTIGDVLLLLLLLLLVVMVVVVEEVMVVLAEILRVDNLLRGRARRRWHLFGIQRAVFVRRRTALLSADHVPAAVG